MKWSIFAGVALATQALAQQNDVVTEFASTVTVGSTPLSTAAGAGAVNNIISTSASSPTTFSTFTRTATVVSATHSAAATDDPFSSSGGYETTQTGTDTNAGASGGDHSSFHISQGGLIAIIVVCVVVVILGVASTILYVIAKRRQWDVRGSIARASRRLTGRFGPAKPAPRSDRRRGLHANGMPMSDTKAGHKRGLVVDVKPVAALKDPLRGKAPENTRPREKTWIKDMWGGAWK